MSAALPSCAGAILAGGQASRMGGGKPGATLAGQPMIAHVIDRFRPQVNSMMISVDGADESTANLRYMLVEDLRPSHRGPLVGLYSCLQALVDRLDEPWLALCPCDAPFLPEELVSTLLGATVEAGLKVGVAQYEGHPQPTFSVWHRDLLFEVRADALREGRGGLMQTLNAHSHVTVEWPSSPIPPFYNVNTPDELAQAEAWLADTGEQEANP